MMDRMQRVKTIVREWLLENSDVLDVHGVQTEMVEKIEGDYTNVVGLPLSALYVLAGIAGMCL